MNQSQPTATTVTPTTAKIPTTTTDTSSTTSKPTVQQLIDLVQEIKKVSDFAIPTTVPASTPVCKQEQMASAASTTPVTKEDFETFKREMLQLSTRNSERFPPPSQSMPGTYNQNLRNVSEIFLNSYLFFIPTHRFYHFIPEEYPFTVPTTV